MTGQVKIELSNPEQYLNSIIMKPNDPLQDYFDEQKDKMWQQYCYDEIEEYNRKARIAFGLEFLTSTMRHPKTKQVN